MFPVLPVAAIAALGAGAYALKTWKDEGSPSKRERAAFDWHFQRVLTALACRNAPTWRFDRRVTNAEYRARDHEIVVSLPWFRRLLHDACDDAACANEVIAGILAHELGHATQRAELLQARARRHSHELELEADHIVGMALALLGVEPDNLQHVMAHVFAEGSASHPAGVRRAIAIEAGWRSVRRPYFPGWSPGLA